LKQVMSVLKFSNRNFKKSYIASKIKYAKSAGPRSLIIDKIV